MVLVGGDISNHNGVNIPNIHLDLKYISEADAKDLIFGIENDVDFVAASFVRCKEDLIDLRKFLDYHGGHHIRIIAKIENNEGVQNFEEILKHADGIMVARGGTNAFFRAFKILKAANFSAKTQRYGKGVF